MDYLKYFEKAVMYIENNLKENITVNDVAKESGYSYYHLTRLFKSMFGESVGSYIKKDDWSIAQKNFYTVKKR